MSDNVKGGRERWAGRKGPWIQTRSCSRWYFIDAYPSDVVVEDVAFSLAQQSRFSGHVPVSVASHSLRVEELVAARVPDSSATSLWLQLFGLVHDAHEAYLLDVSTPLKMLLPEYRELEERTENVVREALGLGSTSGLPDPVKEADAIALAEEVHAHLDPADWETLVALDEASVRRVQQDKIWSNHRIVPDGVAQRWLARFSVLVRELGVDLKARRVRGW